MSEARVIDLNVDAGETEAGDRALAWVSSANIACGGHAGDELSMERTVRLALAAGCAVGAHPSYPDKSGFGRVRLDIPPQDLLASLREQIGSLWAIVRMQGAELSHVKPHGALYHAMSDDVAVLDLVVEASAGLPLVVQAGSASEYEARQRGVHVIREGFADRCYRANGQLLDRTNPKALIESSEIAAQQAVSLAGERRAIALDGSCVPVSCETICLHTDLPGSLLRVQRVRSALEEQGFTVAPLAFRRGL